MGRKTLVEQRRLEICNAFFDCMIKNGSYDATSLKDIGEALGCSPGILLHYFKSKEEILLVTSRKVIKARNDAFISILTEKNPQEKKEKIRFLLNDKRNTIYHSVMGTANKSCPAQKQLFLELREEYFSELRRQLPGASDYFLNAVTFLFKSIIHHYTSFADLYNFGDYLVEMLMREITFLSENDSIRETV